MKPTPYNWQGHHPARLVTRGARVIDIAEHLRRGVAVKIIGGRGMGKSVLLCQVQAHLLGEPGTRVVMVPSPPEEGAVPGAVRDLAARLGVRDLSPPRIDDLLDRVIQGEVTRLVVIIDEADQYVMLGGGGGEDALFARSWFNKLEATRRQQPSRFNVVIAGGLGLLYLDREMGSALVSRAEPCVLEPFTPEEIAELAAPFEEDGRPLDETCLTALRVFSGGSPALVTYGLQHLWAGGRPSVRQLELIFGVFRERHDSFVRAVQASVSQRGGLEAPWRVLEAVRDSEGSVPLQRLRDACTPRGDGTTVDPKQALDLLRAAGLVRIEGSALADPVLAWPVASILNLPETPAGSDDPIERLVRDVCAVLSNLRRFGRDFHHEGGLPHEDLFSSVIALGLRLLGWLETDREAIQAAGYTDIKVHLVSQPELGGHMLIETKLWRQKEYNEGIQRQINDYRIADTFHAIAVTLGDRRPEGWPQEYERVCLAGLIFEKRDTPADLVGWWRVRQPDPDGRDWFTDHLLVQLPKRKGGKPNRSG